MVYKSSRGPFIENEPFSFNKVIFDSKGTPVDYVLIECNPALEEALDQNKSQLLGKSMSEWLFTSETLHKDCYEKLGRLVLSAEGEELDEVIEHKDKRYYLTAHVPYPGYLIVLLRDISSFHKAKMELREIKNSLAQSHALSQVVSDNSPIAVITYKVVNNGAAGSDYIIQNANPICLKIEGWKKENVLGKSLKEVRPGVDDFGIIEIFQQVWKTGNTMHYPAKVYWEGSHYRWFENIVFRLPSGEIVAAYEDITKKKHAEQKLYAQKEKLRMTLGAIDDEMIFEKKEGPVEAINEDAKAVTKETEDKTADLCQRDSLTGFYNRAYFENELDRLDEKGHFPMTFVLGGFSGLHLIKEVFGSQMGDKACIKAAKTLKAACRSGDLICRFGKDEFLILLTDTSEEGMNKFRKQLNEVCSNMTVRDIGLSFSVGCARKRDPRETWRQVLKRARNDMYKIGPADPDGDTTAMKICTKNTPFETPEIEEYGERLGRVCKCVGKSMGLPLHMLDEMELLAMLHDISKIAIDDRILKKPDKLTKIEWYEMKKHPETGYRIAQKIPEFRNISECILAHHERWDGEGYPKGLKGKEIPIMSRILAVVDAYDAMTQERPYREALSAEEAEVELKINAGTQFDPEVVDVFLKYLEEKAGN